MNRLLILTFISFYSLTTFACKVQAPRYLNLAMSLENKKSYFYNDLRIVDLDPYAQINECFNAAAERKFLMISTEQLSSTHEVKVKTYSINDELTAGMDTCKLNNSPFENIQTAEQRVESLNSRRNFLNKCVVYKITDFSRAGLSYPENQPGCTIKKIGKNSANFTGGFCYFEPKQDSSFSFQIEANPECLDKGYLSQNSIDLQDVDGRFGYYISGDASGRSLDLQAIGKTDFRISIDPLDTIVETGKDVGVEQPQWPSSWMGGSIELGEVSFRPTYDGYKINVDLLASNTCEKKCVNGICSSPCNYSLPVVGEFNLFILENGRKEFLKNWVDGGVAPQNFQGIVGSIGEDIEGSLLENGKKYVVEAEITDPAYLFALFKGRIDRLLSLNPNHIPEIDGNGFINEIPVFNPSIDIAEVGEIPTIRNGVTFGGGISVDLRSQLGNMNRYFKNSFWPPYFEKACVSPLKCMDVNKLKMKLSYSFSLKKEGENFKAQNINYSRVTSFGESKNTLIDSFPKIDCGDDEIIDDSSDDVDSDIDF